MKKFEAMKADPDRLGCELAGISGLLMMLYNTIDGQGGGILDDGIILDSVFSLSEYVRRVSDDVTDLAGLKTELEASQRLLQIAQSCIDTLKAKDKAEDVTA